MFDPTNPTEERTARPPRQRPPQTRRRTHRSPAPAQRRGPPTANAIRPRCSAMVPGATLVRVPPDGADVLRPALPRQPDGADSCCRFLLVLFVLNYFAFRVWVAIPVVSAILERAVCVLLGVFLYKVMTAKSPATAKCWTTWIGTARDSSEVPGSQSSGWAPGSQKTLQPGQPETWKPRHLGTSPMIRLGVNIDHVATVRQARRAKEPDPVAAAVLATLGGADGITVHLREDRRHIQDRDVYLLRETVTTRLNLEMAASEEIIAHRAEGEAGRGDAGAREAAGADDRGRARRDRDRGRPCGGASSG